MLNDTFVELMSEADYHVDELGRVVIDNESIMREINGAAGFIFRDGGCNANCVNGACH